jgi:hypothetical protein
MRVQLRLAEGLPTLVSNFKLEIKFAKVGNLIQKFR